MGSRTFLYVTQIDPDFQDNLLKVNPSSVGDYDLLVAKFPMSINRKKKKVKGKD